MIIRKIKKQEFIRLYDLFPEPKSLWNEYYNLRMLDYDNKESDTYIIEENNKILGELTVNYVSHDLDKEALRGVRAYLEAFRIIKEMQGKGLGQQLIKYAINDLISQGYKEFTVGCEEDNKNALHIYNKLGFTTKIQHGYGDKFDPSEYDLYLKKIEN